MQYCRAIILLHQFENKAVSAYIILNVQNMTHQFMHEYIIQSSIISKITNKSSHIYVSTSKYTVACRIKSTKSTSNALQLITIICPFTTVSIHIVFEFSSRTAKRVEKFSVITIITDVYDDPVFPGCVRWVSVRYQHSRIRWQSVRA